MRKGLTTFLVILLALGAVLVSCKAEIEAPADELVAVSFEERTSRALSATLEAFNKADFYWYYAAAKTDSTGLLSGQTTTYDVAGAVPVSAGHKGLAGYTVPGFSQGTWKFKLFAYFAVPTSETEKAAWVYSGEATAVVLKKAGTNQVTVTVSPNPQGNGTLFVDKEHISLAEYTPLLSDNQVAPVITIEAIQGGTATVVSGTNVKYTAPAGTYRVTVTYTDGNITYATGDVVATVYSGLTTTVSGNVDELVTYAQFDAEENPDIITRTAASDPEHPVTSVTTDPVALSDTNSDARVSATVPAAAAVAMLPKDGVNPDPNASMSLALNVDTKNSTSTSVTYEISMTKTVTLNSEVTTSDVSSLGTVPGTSVKYYAVATIKLSTGLTGVTVTHGGNAMVQSTSTGDDDGYGVYSYDAGTGILTIQTNSFSPFEVRYNPIAYVASIGDVKYPTLQAAIDAAPVKTETEILVLRDVTDGSGLITSDVTANAKYLTIDFDGHTYVVTGPAVGSTGTSTQAMHWGDDSRITLKNGSFVVAEGAENVKMAMQNYSNLTIKNMTIDVSRIPALHYGNNQYTGNNAIYNGMPIASFNTNRGFLTLRDTVVIINPENGNYGCNVGDSGIALYGKSRIEGGVVFDEKGAMVVAWDESVITGGVNKYFPEDGTFAISHSTQPQSNKPDANYWTLYKVSDGLSGGGWPMYMPDDDDEGSWF